MSAGAFLRQAVRTLLLLFLTALGTVLLMRLAPGYFSDSREMDGRYAQAARAELGTDYVGQSSIRATTVRAFHGLIQGNLGTSRQYDVPVLDLILPRIRVTALLLVRGIAGGWTLALFAGLPLSTLRNGGTLLGLPFTILLAIPCGAMATLCLLSNRGGPALVLTMIIAARDFKFAERLLRSAWKTPHLLQARAQGLRLHQLLTRHILPNVLPSLLSLGTLSIVTALSAIVPLEVIFDVPGMGQLAWTAAINRDLPVLLAVTLLMATAVIGAGSLSQHVRPLEAG